MLSIRLKVELSEIEGYFEKVKTNVKDDVSTGLDEVGRSIVRFIKFELLEGQLVQKRTGKLQESIYFKKVGKDRIRVSMKGARARIGYLIDQGVGHTWIIRARRARTLKFIATSGPNAGSYVFPRQVTHPGIKARHFMRKAAEANQKQAKETLKKSVQKGVRRSRRNSRR